MPLHKSSRAPRLDPTMISAPLDDFRHTMHIGRGGDAFGDTSFLSSHGPSPASPDLSAPGTPVPVDSQIPVNHSENATDGLGPSQNNDLQHSESVSSFTLDLDLGPSILGDVLGVMDGLGLDSTNEEDVFSPNNNTAAVEMNSGKGMCEDLSVCMQNDFNEKELVGMEEKQTGDKVEVKMADGSWSKPKGLRPKVRFSDKREEIIRQASEEDEVQGFNFQDKDEQECHTPTVGKSESGIYLSGESEAEFTDHKADVPPSPASSLSSENDVTVPLHCRRVDDCHSETDSEEEEMGECGRGYTFEDEFDDEIGL